MGNIKNYCQQCQILSNIESLYKSLNVNSLTVNECFSAKSTKNSKSLSRQSQSQSLTTNHHMIHSNIR